MIRICLVLLLLFCLGCAKDSYTIKGMDIEVNSTINEPNKFKTFRLSQFNTGSAFSHSKAKGSCIDQGGFYVEFANDSLKRYNFKGQFCVANGLWCLFDLEQFESRRLIDSLKQNNIILKVYEVTSNHPGYLKMGFGNKLRAVYGVKKENGLTVDMINYSDLNQSFSEEFLLEKFKEIDFNVLE